ncbi:RdgB/HAM1 family non-canonical purine NTP pyrophosphatase [Nocardia terpenica]|uniref:dITP/XTP pyrophosphatase n=1 Tax=Nocardia terpenica TaxID=455432 RepID=A0A161WGI0_9NOCA|nr:RdgB/HAM1 family non-canonical purine NTP pyrophosphatase [Nocardia terpenica]KZM76099.1 non-canonical purine NTP pyrophosphatase [Nocardia terpenica]MBF6063581.1 RdgB/HAM1 family non-canonical purine NTP pyrophosphatase [Nocardia terpenica]MBF6109410.1 RdgB/HAM1 family non-canonical purine NTP pyrophosphatase [Nocardia terpenica]MBF6114130.1 RdgB/HAM1 family non-canonical purine NTP pyrophosphatase [Nocardia terpenica]MBF6123800.1 RdgB/HAM1 family non-canonical purine NTP pyrophosphatase [
MTRTILVASRNAKKLDELRRILTEAGIEGLRIVGLDEVPPYEEAPETGATFEENALAKARDGAAATGLACVADDSGLAVDALNGMPGVLSARWSGRHGDDAANNALLLAQLHDVPDHRRGARFISACALVADGRETVVVGEWPGTLTRHPIGTEGFGYDPLFTPTNETRTSAQLTPAEKNATSHRARALRALLPTLASLAER